MAASVIHTVAGVIDPDRPILRAAIPRAASHVANDRPLAHGAKRNDARIWSSFSFDAPPGTPN